MTTDEIAVLAAELADAAGYELHTLEDGAFMELTLTGERRDEGWPIISTRVNVNRATPERVANRVEAAIERLDDFVRAQ